MSKHRADTVVRHPKHRGSRTKPLSSATAHNNGNTLELLATLYGHLAVFGSVDTEQWNQAVMTWSQPSE